tara:strand:- start:246 stop:461 length:216 start_codon:yes stop_codon:yes gene_type:complete
MKTLGEQKQYLKELISHYELLISMDPKNELVKRYSEYIQAELFNSKRKLRNIIEREIEGIYFAKNYQWLSK